jgi:putative SOS response-associated peptidase YedK
MCGRYSRHAAWRDLVEYFRILDDPRWNLEPRYNIAPTQQVLIERNETALLKFDRGVSPFCPSDRLKISDSGHYRRTGRIW